MFCMFCNTQTSAAETAEPKSQRLMVPETIFQGMRHRAVGAKKIKKNKLIGPSLLQEISAPPALITFLTYYLSVDDNCVARRRSALPQFAGCQRFLLSVSSWRKINYVRVGVRWRVCLRLLSLCVFFFKFSRSACKEPAWPLTVKPRVRYRAAVWFMIEHWSSKAITGVIAFYLY